MTDKRDYDVAVIGSGAAGLAAAVQAADEGAQVVVLEADRQVGGSSRLSGGHFYAAGTSVQREAGIEDSAEEMFDHYMTLNQWMVEPSVVRTYCERSGPTLEWMRELGVEYTTAGLYASGVGKVPRGHSPTGEGHAVIDVLDRQRQKRGVDLALAVRIDRLLFEDGRVVGAASGDEQVRTGAVVLATGGFGANPELLEKFYPDAAAGGDWTWYIGTEGAQGDGLRLGQEVGGVIEGHNRGLLLLTPGFSRDLEIGVPGWTALVSRDGRRFCDETANYTLMAGLVKRAGGVAYAIFDEAARIAAEPGLYNRAFWNNEVLEKQARDGRIVRADSLEELGRRAGIDPIALAGTLESYNRDCDQRRDSNFFKDPQSGMRALRTPPFYAVEVRPAVICWTGAGLRIDAQTRVLGRDEQPIPGLFAAGETVGSLHGDRYIGGGGSYGPCLVFGRLAGENAAHLALRAN